MKKLFSLFLLVGFFAFATACGEKKEEAPKENTEEAAPDGSTPDVPSADSTAATPETEGGVE